MKISAHVKESASMRRMADEAIAEAKHCTAQKVLCGLMCIAIVVDFMQNMDLPSFGSNQPGETYYYTPVNVNTLGIVDCNNEKDHLHGYIYDEGEANKGGNVVASLIIKHLKDRGLLEEGVKRKKLSIIMDNCVGQNKNNYVLRLAPYLVRKGYFSHVQFVFLVVGHTKNAADRFFNALKLYYRDENVFSMNTVIELCGRHPQVTATRVYFNDMYNWEDYLGSFYSKLKKIKLYQLYEASNKIGNDRMVS